MVDLDSGDTVIYYSKGTHDPLEFTKEVEREFESVINPEKVETGFMRWEMCSGPDGWCHVGEIYKTSGRGKFPITFVDLWET